MATIGIKGIIGTDVTSLKLKAWLKANPSDEYTFVIDSKGGSIEDGFEIAKIIETLPNTTAIARKVYSIATVIYLACEKRISDSASSFMVHTPWVEPKKLGNSLNRYTLAEYSDALTQMEKPIAEYYAARTGLTYEEAVEAMKKDNFFSGEEAYSLGFANQFHKLKAVAMFQKFLKKVKNEAEEKTPEEPKSEMPELADLIEKIASIEARIAAIEETMAKSETQIAEELPQVIAEVAKNALAAQMSAFEKTLAELKISSKTNGAANLPQKSANLPSQKASAEIDIENVFQSLKGGLK